MKHCRYKDKNGVCQNRECLFYGLANLCKFCEAGDDYKPQECAWYHKCETFSYIKHECGRRLPDSLDDCEGICEHFDKERFKW